MRFRIILNPENPKRETKQVLVQHSAFHGVADRFYYVMIPDSPIVICKACGRMFLEVVTCVTTLLL